MSKTGPVTRGVRLPFTLHEFRISNGPRPFRYRHSPTYGLDKFPPLFSSMEFVLNERTGRGFPKGEEGSIERCVEVSGVRKNRRDADKDAVVY